MRKFIFILAIFPILALNFTAVSYSAPGISEDVIHNNSYFSQPKKQSENENKPSYFLLITDALGEAEAEEKILLTQFIQYPFIEPLISHALKDQFSIPFERFYLPDEPPIQ